MVNIRRREIGLLMALGAVRRDILRRFIVQALRVAAIACVCGLALSMAFTGALSSMLYGISPNDPTTLTSVVAIVLLVAAIASLIPSIRAARLDPMHVLRDE